MNVARKSQVGNLAGPCQRTPEFNFPAVGSESLTGQSWLSSTAHRLRGACHRQRPATLPSGEKLSEEQWTPTSRGSRRWNARLRRCNNSCGSRTTVADIWGSKRRSGSLLQSRSYGGAGLTCRAVGERGVAQRGDAVERRRADRRWRPARWLRGAGNASLAQSDNERLPSRPPMCREWVRFRDKNRNRDQ